MIILLDNNSVVEIDFGKSNAFFFRKKVLGIGSKVKHVW